VDVRRLADGLWRWTASHPNAANWPDWGPPVPPEVGCVYYEAPDAVVLLDPLLPAGRLRVGGLLRGLDRLRQRAVQLSGHVGEMVSQ